MTPAYADAIVITDRERRVLLYFVCVSLLLGIPP
jgi:hypothetical protein